MFTFPASAEQVIRDRFQRQANELRYDRDCAALRKLDAVRAGDTKMDLYLGGKIEGLEIAIQAIEVVVGQVDCEVLA